MKKPSNRFLNILLRYSLLIIVAFPSLYIFYLIFTPLTVYPVHFLISLFFNASLIGEVILVNNLAIEFIEACIAGSAYYLLFILNLSTPEIKFNKRLRMIFLAFGVFLLVNILRIFFLSIIFIAGSRFFAIAHEFFWYFVSIVLVVGIWFAEVKIFNLKEIPLYSDLRFLYENSVMKRK